jgi:hypothetical protein
MRIPLALGQSIHIKMTGMMKCVRRQPRKKIRYMLSCNREAIPEPQWRIIEQQGEVKRRYKGEKREHMKIIKSKKQKL